MIDVNAGMVGNAEAAGYVPPRTVVEAMILDCRRQGQAMLDLASAMQAGVDSPITPETVQAAADGFEAADRLIAMLRRIADAISEPAWPTKPEGTC